jgi:hypothetical protein
MASGAELDFVVEFVVQVLFEIVGEFLSEFGFRATAAVLRSRIGRYAIAIAVGGAGGVWWGARLSTRGRVQEPRALWVSLVLAAVAAGLAALRWFSASPDDEVTGVRAAIAPPWRWPFDRLVAFVLLNSAIAVGIAIGFHPHAIAPR